jgi:ubiquitin C-terminal hydrolase
MELSWTLIHSHGIGLANNGIRDKNLCFINSVVQCLAHTSALAQWLVTEKDKSKNCMY